MSDESGIVQEEESYAESIYNGVDSSISVPVGEDSIEYTFDRVEAVTIEQIDISSWAFIGLGACGALLMLSIGIATILRMLRGSM